MYYKLEHNVLSASHQRCPRNNPSASQVLIPKPVHRWRHLTRPSNPLPDILLSLKPHKTQARMRSKASMRASLSNPDPSQPPRIREERDTIGKTLYERKPPHARNAFPPYRLLGRLAIATVLCPKVSAIWKQWVSRFLGTTSSRERRRCPHSAGEPATRWRDGRRRELLEREIPANDAGT